MIERLEARAEAVGAARVKAILDRVAAADLPAGFVAEREDDMVAIRGPGLMRRLAFDARLRSIGLIARGA